MSEAMNVQGGTWEPPPHVQALALLKNQIQLIAVFTLSAVLTALLLTYVFSEKYEAGTTIQYRQTEITLLKSMDTQSFGSEAPSAPFKVVSQTIDDLVHSWALLGPVVDAFDLTASDRYYTGPWWTQILRRSKDFIKDIALEIWGYMKFGRYIEPNARAEAIKKLSENVKLINKDSYIFTIVVRDKRGQRAAAIADAIAEQLVDSVRAQSILAGTAKREQIEGLMAIKDNELQERQARIDEFMRANRLVSVDEEIAHGTERASDLEKQLIVHESELSSLVSRVARIDSMLNSRNGEYIAPDDRQKLQSEKLATQINIRGLTSQIESLRSNLEELHARLRELPTLDLQLETMQIELEGTKRDWIQLRDGLQEAIVRENQVASEIRILNRAVVPTAPASPIKAYHVGLAAVAGLLASVALVFTLDFFNIRFLFASLGVAGRRGAGRAAGTPSREDGGRRDE